MAERVLFYIMIFQGIYYLATAIWPIISLSSFMALAGPKPDRFIFWAIDFLIIAVGASILFGVIRGDLVTTSFLGAASAFAFIAVEFMFAGKISRYFWIDTAVEILIFVGILGTVLS